MERASVHLGCSIVVAHCGAVGDGAGPCCICQTMAVRRGKLLIS